MTPQPESHTDPPVVTVTQLLPETAPPGRALITFPGRDFLPPVPPESRPYRFNEIRKHDPHRIVLPPPSTLFSLIFPRVPPEPHIPLSFLGAERLQLSDAALGELDMKLYVSGIRSFADGAD